MEPLALARAKYAERSLSHRVVKELVPALLAGSGLVGSGVTVDPD